MSAIWFIGTECVKDFADNVEWLAKEGKLSEEHQADTLAILSQTNKDLWTMLELVGAVLGPLLEEREKSRVVQTPSSSAGP